MRSDDFEKVIEAQLDYCRQILVKKASEYATDDRLHNFKQAAHLQRCTPQEALAGMMAKHTISIYDMLKFDAYAKKHSIALWEEKITDSINYLLLLKALVIDEENNMENKENTE